MPRPMLCTKEITYRRCNQDEPRDARLGQGKIVLRYRDFRDVRRRVISSQNQKNREKANADRRQDECSAK